ncbi:MAG: chloride channel protein [Chromatiales bacterium]|nr:chloride channel protein [Chromatiales bacterium]
MTAPQNPSGRWRRWLEARQQAFAGVDGLPSLAGLGLLVGLLAGAVIVGFRHAIDAAQTLTIGTPDRFELLPPLARLGLAMAGGLAIGLVLLRLPAALRAGGVVHVIERLDRHQGRLPFGNAVAHFLLVVLATATGQSVGREGPGVHLGAAVAGSAGGHLGLPNHSLRTLVGCGVAAAIAASFNTPLAGVVFAMEVVLMEYTIAGFAPVILAAVSATAISQLAFGDAPAFGGPMTALGSLGELPIVLALGIGCGLLAAAFTFLTRHITRVSDPWPIWLRPALAGLIVGLIALAVPEVMGLGYDSVGAALAGELAVATMLAIVVAKLVATAACIGLAMPGGLIGPSLVIGAAAGGAVGLLVAQAQPDAAVNPAFYALVGLGAMMAATLQAPLAALTAMLELTANPHIILPGMLAVISAGLVSQEWFGQRSVFRELLRARGMDLRDDALTLALRRVGVARQMDRAVVTLDTQISADTAHKALANKPNWVLVRAMSGDASTIAALMPAADLARALAALAALEADDDSPIDLAKIPANRLDVVSVPYRASQFEALEAIERANADAAWIAAPHAAEQPRGVLTRAAILRSYAD